MIIQLQKFTIDLRYQLGKQILLEEIISRPQKVDLQNQRTKVTDRINGTIMSPVRLGQKHDQTCFPLDSRTFSLRFIIKTIYVRLTQISDHDITRGIRPIWNQLSRTELAGFGSSVDFHHKTGRPYPSKGNGKAGIKETTKNVRIF